MGNKIWIEDLVREVDAEQRKEGPDLDFAKIAERAEQEMERRRLLKKKRRTHIVAAAVILVAVLVVSFSALSLEEGYGEHFRRMFIRDSVQEDEIRMDNFIDGENKNAYRAERMSLEEMRDLVAFDVSLPEYLPEGYVMGEVEVTYFFEELTKIVITYENYNSLEKVEYTIAPLEYRKARTDHIDVDKSEVKIISSNGIEYRYTNNEEGNIISWDYNELFYMVEGNLMDEELIAIAFSIDYEGDKNE